MDPDDADQVPLSISESARQGRRHLLSDEDQRLFSPTDDPTHFTVSSERPDLTPTTHGQRF